MKTLRKILDWADRYYEVIAVLCSLCIMCMEDVTPFEVVIFILFTGVMKGTMKIRYYLMKKEKHDNQ